MQQNQFVLTVSPEDYPLVKFCSLDRCNLVYTGGHAEHYGSWLYYEEDLRQISVVYPTVLFQLDIWGADRHVQRVYFKNGKMHDVEVKIVYEEFDESKAT